MYVCTIYPIIIYCWFKCIINNLTYTVLTSDRNRLATAWSACLGQAVNQSIEELFTRPGKFLQRFLSVSPTGDMAITMCKLLAHLLTKYPQVLSLVGGRPAFWASARTWIMSVNTMWILCVYAHVHIYIYIYVCVCVYICMYYYVQYICALVTVYQLTHTRTDYKELQYMYHIRSWST